MATSLPHPPSHSSVRAHFFAGFALLSLASVAFAQRAAAKPVGTQPAVTSVPQQPLPIALVSRLPACIADVLLVSTDEEGGNFNGMSHGGTLLILRNRGTTVCRILPLAQASLLDRNGKSLGPFSTRSPHSIGMHPGPVVLPIALAVNAELTATLYWVSGPVFNDNLCLDAATLVLKFGDLTLRTPFGGRLCGERANGVSADLSRFTPDQIVQARTH